MTIINFGIQVFIYRIEELWSPLFFIRRIWPVDHSHIDSGWRRVVLFISWLSDFLTNSWLVEMMSIVPWPAVVSIDPSAMSFFFQDLSAATSGIKPFWTSPGKTWPANHKPLSDRIKGGSKTQSSCRRK